MNQRISKYLTERIAANDFPSAVYLVAEKGRIVFHDALGHSVVEPERIEARPDTIYDVASLTKVLVTGLLTALALDRGSIELETAVADVLPEFEASAVGRLNIRQLATHTTGLTAWLPLYLLAETPVEVPAVLAARDSIDPDTRVEYSDLNFIILGNAVVRRSATANDSIASEFFKRVIEPLGLQNTAFNPLSSGHIFEREKFAASEKGNEYEKQTCIEMGFLRADAADTIASRFRKRQIWGEVHDGNAFFMKGAAGHAGLFSNATDIFTLALQFLPDHTRLLKPGVCSLFSTNFTKDREEDRSFTFQLASTEGATAGTRMSPESFGHNGFTGTSLWIDPVKNRIFVLLTNRTHNHPLPFININSVRRRFHDIAVDELDAR